MDSLDDHHHHRLISGEAYFIYCLFISVMFVAVKDVPKEASKKAYFIALFLFTINSFAAWFGLGEDCNPMAFYLVFFPTMIATPGVLIYHLECVHHLLITDEDYLLM